VLVLGNQEYSCDQLSAICWQHDAGATDHTAPLHPEHNRVGLSWRQCSMFPAAASKPVNGGVEPILACTVPKSGNVLGCSSTE
jgi:hypothetical protein